MAGPAYAGGRVGQLAGLPFHEVDELFEGLGLNVGADRYDVGYPRNNDDGREVLYAVERLFLYRN